MSRSRSSPKAGPQSSSPIAAAKSAHLGSHSRRANSPCANRKRFSVNLSSILGQDCILIPIHKGVADRKQLAGGAEDCRLRARPSLAVQREWYDCPILRSGGTAHPDAVSTSVVSSAHRVVQDIEHADPGIIDYSPSPRESEMPIHHTDCAVIRTGYVWNSASTI